MDLRLSRAKARDARREPARPEGGKRRERQARLVEIHRADEAGAQRREGTDGLLRDELARRRELDPMRMPQEQRDTDLPLELAHVITHRSSGSFQLLRGLRETAQARRGLEGADR